MANNASFPTLTATPNLVIGLNPTAVSVAVANPISNAYAITGITFSAPTGWSFTGPFAAPAGWVVAASSASAIAFTSVAGLMPGFSASFALGTSLTGPDASTSPSALIGTFTTSLVDTSSMAAYTGPSFNLFDIAPFVSLTVALSPVNLNYVAGSAPYAVTATLGSGQSGVPIVFSAPGYTGSQVYSFTTTSATTGSTGKATTTFQPSNHATDATAVRARIGTSGAFQDSGVITTQPAAPAKVGFNLLGVAFPATHYVTLKGTTVNTGGSPPAAFTGARIAAADVTYFVSDAFGNAVAGTLSGITTTLVAVSGSGLFDAATLPSQVTTALASGPLPADYFQSGTYSTVGLISGTIAGTYTPLGGTASAFSVSGSSGNILTSTFDVAGPTPSVTATTYTAGKTIQVWATLTNIQAGVPVTLYTTVSSSSTPANTGTFPGGIQKITLYTNSSGIAATTYALDTTSGDATAFVANLARPTDANPSAATANGTASATVTTVAGAAASFILKVYFGPLLTNAVKSSAVNGSNLNVNVGVADAFGNLVTVPPGQQIQVLLVTTSGLLSVTSAYIPAGFSDTFGGFGQIQWTLPSTIGTAVTLTASGVLNGAAATATKTVTTVSGLPTLAVTSPTPLNGVIYSNTGSVIFGGNANASAGYPTTVTIVSVGYQVDNGSWQSAAVAAANKITWSVLAVMSSGLHTITINATDSNGNTAVSAAYEVLVDTSNPSITITTADGATLTAGTGLTATIVSSQGDLNFTSVIATYNGTALPASGISITGTNNLGVNTTYSVTVTGLPQGVWTVTLSASSLAGNAATPQSITVTVFVSTNQYFTLLGTASQITFGGFPAVNATYTNNLNSAQTGIVFAVVKNSLGQTVYYTTSTISPAAGASASAILVLAGLAHGTYSVNIFVVSSANVAVSTSTTVSVTI